MVRIPLAADDSLAAMRARSRFGMAMAAMIRMIATTISNSISEKPFCFRISFLSSLVLSFLVVVLDHWNNSSHSICQRALVRHGQRRLLFSSAKDLVQV